MHIGTIFCMCVLGGDGREQQGNTEIPTLYAVCLCVLREGHESGHHRDS